jgi:hypothetical protein
MDDDPIVPHRCWTQAPRIEDGRTSRISLRIRSSTVMVVVDDAQLQVLAEQLATDVLAGQLRPNRLTRYGETRSSALANVAVFAGTPVAAGRVCRRIFSNTDPLGAERFYAKTVTVDRSRAHADVHYVDQRLRLLAVATDDDPEELIRGAAYALDSFVAAGRPVDQCVDEVEHAYAPLREAADDRQPVAELLGAYLDAWRCALSHDRPSLTGCSHGRAHRWP